MNNAHIDGTRPEESTTIPRHDIPYPIQVLFLEQLDINRSDVNPQ